MTNRWRKWMWISGITAGLGVSGMSISGMSLAQSGDSSPRKTGGIVGAKSQEGKSHEGMNVVWAQNQHRDVEIQIELAWMADPVTFPYLLQAKVRGSEVEVSGIVPSAKVRATA